MLADREQRCTESNETYCQATYAAQGDCQNKNSDISNHIAEHKIDWDSAECATYAQITINDSY